MRRCGEMPVKTKVPPRHKCRDGHSKETTIIIPLKGEIRNGKKSECCNALGGSRS